jgi:fermentation-respiration switch protein FrsA (DUF1100 family)
VTWESARQAVLHAAGLALLACVALLAGLILMEARFIYFPQKALVAHPAAFGLKADDLWLRTGDGVRLHGWWIYGAGERVLVWYHGNAGNISHRLENARLLVERLGLDVVLVDYRGYGRSEGAPSEPGLYQDGRTMYQAVAGRGFRPEQIVLFGRSLGAAVAVDVALDRPCGAVILETPFLSVPALARRFYPFIPGFLIRTRFDSERKIARLTAPKLILHAERDEVVPLAHTQRLFALAAPPKRFHLIPGASHNDTYVVGGDEYVEVWRRFLAATPGADSPSAHA